MIQESYFLPKQNWKNQLEFHGLKYQEDHYAFIHTWENMKIAINSYVVPPTYKQLTIL